LYLQSYLVRVIFMTCAFQYEKAGAQKAALDQRKSIGNFKLSFEALNYNGQGRVAILPLRFSKLDPSNSPVRVVARFWSATLDNNALKGSQ
jgi:hypothetical protein